MFKNFFSSSLLNGHRFRFENMTITLYELELMHYEIEQSKNKSKIFLTTEKHLAINEFFVSTVY